MNLTLQVSAWGHAPVICATGVRRTGAWGSPMADPDERMWTQAESHPAPRLGPGWPTQARVGFTPQKHPIEP